MDFVTLRLAIGCLIIYLVYQICRRCQKILSQRYDRKNQDISNLKVHKEKEVTGYDVFKAENIFPLSEFNWETTPPLKIRHFKSKYHLTMGITNIPLSSLIEIDNNYLSRLKLRKEIISKHHSAVLKASASIEPAINEFYTFLVKTYLPTRFPLLFTLTNSSLLNQATGNSLPTKPPTNPLSTLQLLGENLDEEFLFLIPAEDGDGYSLQGFVTCFPSGFDMREKFGLKLRDVHGPVPGYREKLGRSMDRFFERLEEGKLVLRSNWSIQTHDRLYAPTENHLHQGDVAGNEKIDLNYTFLRIERQCLHRLPQTKAIVFSFKTYLYPLQEIKDDGLGEELAAAIDGLKEGSVPAMHFYKKGVVWGETVKEFLRC